MEDIAFIRSQSGLIIIRSTKQIHTITIVMIRSPKMILVLFEAPILPITQAKPFVHLSAVPAVAECRISTVNPTSGSVPDCVDESRPRNQVYSALSRSHSGCRISH